MLEVVCNVPDRFRRRLLRRADVDLRSNESNPYKSLAYRNACRRQFRERATERVEYGARCCRLREIFENTGLKTRTDLRRKTRVIRIVG